MTETRLSPILGPDEKPLEVPRSQGRYRSHPAWMGTRHWEAAETNRLNQAHWLYAQDTAINQWLCEHLATLRARSIYESRQNGMVSGMLRTHADDIVGADGPTLQVESDDEQYNKALEEVWQGWFAAPTMRPNVSGPALLKLWIHNFWRCGEIGSRIATDPAAQGPVAMRLWPFHPRRLMTPAEGTGDPNVIMGIRFDAFGRPATYYISDVAMNGQAATSMTSQPWPADLIIHEFLVDEEDQCRGFPWLTSGLNPAADLRDYDDQIQDAARQSADMSALLFTTNPDAPVWSAPESTTVERRTIRTVPPGWQPWQYGAGSNPPVQYTDYRAERQRELGRPMNMPLLLIRLDASKHNFASAKIDCIPYSRTNESLQQWLSGTARSYGTLNRLVDELAKEARFSVPALRRRPARVKYRWTWPRRAMVDPAKEGIGETIGLQNLTVTLSDALAARGKDLESHIAALKRELKLFADAGLPIPGDWIKNPSALLAMLAKESEGETAEVSGE